MIQAPMKTTTKRKRIMLVQLPTAIEQQPVVRYSRSTMPNLASKYIDIETSKDTLHFNMMFHDSTPLYFVQSRKYIGWYYPVREYANGNRSCRCLEFQDHGYCKDVMAVEEVLPATASSVA